MLALRDAGDGGGAATVAIRELGPPVLLATSAPCCATRRTPPTPSRCSPRTSGGACASRGEASLRTWAYRLAWNAAQNLRDEAWRRRGRRFATGEASALADGVRTGTVVVVERQRAGAGAAAGGASGEDQSLLVLRVDQGLSLGPRWLPSWPRRGGRPTPGR